MRYICANPGCKTHFSHAPIVQRGWGEKQEDLTFCRETCVQQWRRINDLPVRVNGSDDVDIDHVADVARTVH